MLYELSEFIDNKFNVDECPISYWYQGRCPITGSWHKLPRTKLSEVVAYGLMRQLATDEQYSCEGKMYGILLVETSQRKLQVLKAFSGLFRGKHDIEGWVSPITRRSSLMLEEAYTLNVLEEIKQELLSLQKLPERFIYQHLSEEFKTKLNELAALHQENKQKRHRQRNLLQSTLSGEALIQELELLNQQSRLEGIERRRVKSQRDEALQPMWAKIISADAQIRHLKQRRKVVSNQLQQLISSNYSVSNFAGESLSLESFGALPTGVGECCAPKLLHYAATHNLTPVAMAEFWWGPEDAKNDKIRGKFYPACSTRCQPLMGFLLSGLSNKQQTATIKVEQPLPIVYQDEELIAVNKPEGLLSVPGRSSNNYDSVISRLRNVLADGHLLMSVHRLDRDTSGILLLARNRSIYNHLAQQFRERKVIKIYQALVHERVSQREGTIKLPLWGDPCCRPFQKVDLIRGKESITHFRVIAFEENYTRIEFVPTTGRTHQIRVHCADKQGLGIPIVGDRLYGRADQSTRLYLHALELRFIHPKTGEFLTLRAEMPF